MLQSPDPVGEVLVEVEGQETEYASEMDEGESGESAEESEEDSQDDGDSQDYQYEDSQNNATVASHQPRHGKTSRRSGEISGSVEDPDESLPLEDDMMERMAKFMHSKGLVFASKEELAGQKGELGSRSRVKTKLTNPVQETQSEETIYKRVVQSIRDSSNKRDSSSSDEVIDTSDENMGNPPTVFNSMQFNSDFLPSELQPRPAEPSHPRPGCSSDVGRDWLPATLGPGDQVSDMVQQAERSRACIFDVPGNVPQNDLMHVRQDLVKFVGVSRGYTDHHQGRGHP